jgi:glycine/D-amino acid oxidase-like deaminating enzyme
VVIVVGGGVFGATAAWELARRGYAVRLFEAGDPPRPEAASTDISKLVRADYGVDGFHREMMERALPRLVGVERGVHPATFSPHRLVVVGRAVGEGLLRVRQLRGAVRARPPGDA